jgi:dihydroorotate dehydrogenase (NAD+) catalytic subunit
MITLSNGYSFEYATASGALGLAGKGYLHEQLFKLVGLINPALFLNFGKTPTFGPRKGNFRWWKPWQTIRPLPGGALNAFGLRNRGIHWWAENIGPQIDSSKIPFAGSIFGDANELREMTAIMNRFDLLAIEINASCPNTETDVLLDSNADKIIVSVKEVKSVARFPVGLKLSVAHQRSAEKILRAVEKDVEFLSVNSVPWAIAFPGRKSPMERFGGGGVSGKIAQPFTWPFAEKLQSITDIPVIAPSVWDFQNIACLREKGFKAFSFGSVFLCHPWRPTLFVRKEQAS